MLYDTEEKEEYIPEASNFEKIKARERDIVSLINCDTIEYKDYFVK